MDIFGSKWQTEEFCLLGYNAVWFAGSQLKFRKNLTFNGPHSFIFQRIELFRSIAVRNSNPTITGCEHSNKPLGLVNCGEFLAEQLY
jgi:hypothetical protein